MRKSTPSSSGRQSFLPTILVVVTHLLVPLSLLSEVWRAGRLGPEAYFLSLYVAATYVGFLYLAGAWGWLGGVTRYGLVVLLALVAIGSFGRTAPVVSSPGVILNVLIGTLFLIFLARSLWERRMPLDGVDLRFPLGSRVYLVGQGGSGNVLNQHFRHPSQKYALDILGLNRAGFRCRGLHPPVIWEYAICGDPVSSRCDGIIAAAFDGADDQEAGRRDPSNPPGNHVAIECEGTTIYLAHLLNGSIMVVAGQRVRSGDLIGRVGNSGNTTEPHLHIHAERGLYPGHFSGQPGVPMRFGGRFLVRNDRVRPAAST
jgi:hypothetical protein